MTVLQFSYQFLHLGNYNFLKRDDVMIFTASKKTNIMETSNQQGKYERAQAKVTEIKEFYSHLVTYLIFVCFFLVLNFYTGGFFWAIFPIAGWGIGILSHASNTFGWNPFFSKDWEQRKIDEYIRNEDFK